MINFDEAPLEAPLPDEYGGGGGGGGGNYKDDEARVRRHIEQLSTWGNNNLRDSRRDFVRFWLFRLPAIISSVSTAAAASLGTSATLISILAALAAVCVVIDGLWPGGLLHNIHRRAVHDIRLLCTKAVTELDKVALAHPQQSHKRTQSMLSILNIISAERSRIAKYIADAETSLGVERKGRSIGKN